ncbi:MAG: hypothetical protein CFE44_12485 [Burkholderiales bacterium PBB4]|nr:MAG: hypothetical protein CFE44_12485 [Burkholderiales bacterium PBB4]
MTAPKATPKSWSLRRFDTLFVRLFAQMWLTLVISHLVAYLSVTAGAREGDGPRAPPAPSGGRPLPTFPSLPPGKPWGASGAERAPPKAGEQMPPGPHAHGPSGYRPDLPVEDVWLDYGVRLLIIALGAWCGARWLSVPMQRLSGAALGLTQSLGGTQGFLPLDTQRGTVEVRNAAAVFNQMAQRLQQQFDARGLHMAAVSHDLRTPLTRLRMRVTHIADATQQQAAVADIHEMDELIGDTLAVLREQNDGSAARVVDVGAFLQAFVDDLMEQGLAVQLADLAPMRVVAHPVALRRVVGNLVANALRYAGSAQLSAEQSGNVVTIRVEDGGPGIAPEVLTRAFEPWVRLSESASATLQTAANPSQAGHGLGRDCAGSGAARRRQCQSAQPSGWGAQRRFDMAGCRIGASIVSMQTSTACSAETCVRDTCDLIHDIRKFSMHDHGLIHDLATWNARAADRRRTLRWLAVGAAAPLGLLASHGTRAQQALSEVDIVFSYAELAYAAYFPGPQSNVSANDYVYRYYPSTGNYIGVRSGRVYVFGPLLGASLVDVGPVSTFVALANGTPSATSCSLIPEETAGPYPGDGTNRNSSGVANALGLSGIVRSDIRTSVGGVTGTALGVPLTVKLNLLNVGSSCASLSGYAIYLWHCTRDGLYSMYSTGVTEQNYLRGVQATDASGVATFVTVFPGCYAGRMPHMHFEVFRTLASATSASGKIKTSQIAFPVATCQQVYTAEGYSASVRNLAQISFANDNVFSDGTSLQLASVTGDNATGYVANITVGVNS